MNRKFRKTRAHIFAYPRNSLLYKLYLWIKGRHWWILVLSAVILLILETSDYFRHHYDPVHIIEFAIYMGLLLVVGVLVDLLNTEIQTQNQTRQVLDAKHKLSLEFAGIHDWDGLLDHITHFPSMHAPVLQSCLYLPEGMAGQFMPVSQWTSGELDGSGLFSMELCENCLLLDPARDETFCQCEAARLDDEGKMTRSRYCISFKYAGKTLGILQFDIASSAKLTEGQRALFGNISDEISIALQAAQDRQAHFEMRASETALAERREVSHYLHDHLGQSLGYLHLKMDQLLLERDRLTYDQVMEDMVQMRKAVEDSYEIVRGILETIHAETSPSLTNLLMEHARKISQRAAFEVNFKTRGKPVPLPPEMERAIFYAFEESLSNAEKHARASKIDILAEWARDQFKLTIADNGIGFDPHHVDKDQHFGMEILNERMAKVNGRVTLTTSERTGTVVNINVPKPAGMEGRMRGGVE